MKRIFRRTAVLTLALSLLAAPALAGEYSVAPVAPVLATISTGPALAAGPQLVAAQAPAGAADSIVAPDQIPDPTVDAQGFLLAVLQKLLAGDLPGLAGLLIVGLVYLGRVYGSRLHPFLATGFGAVVQATVLGILGAFGSALLQGHTLPEVFASSLALQLVIKGLSAALTAMGLFSATRATAKARERGALAAAAIGGKEAALGAITAGRK